MTPSRHLINASVTLAATLVGVFQAAMVDAHETDYPRPTEDQLKQIEPPLEGAAEFARELYEQGRTAIGEEQMALLRRAMVHFDYARDIDRGRYPNARPRDEDYHRWRGERALQELIDSGAASLQLDFSAGAPPQQQHFPLRFDGINHRLVWKVRRGDGPMRFVRQDLSLKTERYGKHLTLEVAEGTTCFLLNLKDVPTEPATVVFQVARRGEADAFSWHSLQVETTGNGQLAVEIVEDGEPVPAMVRLRSMPSGALWAPQGAVDFRSQLHDVTKLESPPMLDIYGPMGSLELRLPGGFAGHYWVMPKGFEMSVPPGQWELTVWRGLETEPIRQMLTVQAGEWTRQRVELERWTDCAAKGWYSGDDHVHAQMLGGADADRLLALTRAMDVRVSNILAMGDSQRTYFAQRGFGPDFRVHQAGYWLVPGQEDPRSMLGHNIGLNLTAMARDLDRYLLLDWLAEEVHAQGGLFGQTHVGQNVCEAHRGMALMLPFEVYDFCSIMQSHLGTELYYDALDLGFQLTATAGSDMPYAGVLGDVRTYVHLGEKPLTPDAWFDAVRRGRTFVTNGPMLDLTVNGKLPGEVITVDGDSPLRIKASAQGIAGESAPVGLEIVSLSQVVATARPKAEGQDSLSVKLDLAPGDGRWVAARAWGANGSAAHTTPVWVHREGKRCWNRERVQPLIKKQLGVLDEIEFVVAMLEARQAQGKIGPFDFWERLILGQAEPLRGLLNQSRDRYRKLLAQADAESAADPASTPNTEGP
ncbi:MAG: CehA/McbA family metallohydrolase [Planctomycetota bacterium]